MTNQLIKLTDISLEAFRLTINLSQIASMHPDATWEEPISTGISQHWKLTDMADRLSSIHSVLSIIAETPNGYINQEALEGLRDQFRPAIEVSETDWAKQAMDRISQRFFDDEPKLAE